MTTIRKKARLLLSALGCDEAELSVTFVDNSTIASLNAQWRQVEDSTDVLAFPMDEHGADLPHPRLLGDVVISAERAAAQAEEVGHSLEREIEVLLIHGLLHLMGYDHEASDEQTSAMAQKEADLLRVLLTMEQ
ncbi:MAG: rRNA maturation RNase YbeY [bacterium]|nr:rRNA maturation RNase YbeY [Nitrospinae bacterium AH_259_B05_G02_I21]